MSDSTKLLRELVELVQVCPPLLADIEVSESMRDGALLTRFTTVSCSSCYFRISDSCLVECFCYLRIHITHS